MWWLIAVAGVAAFVLSRKGQPDEAAPISWGLRRLPNCDLEVVDDGPILTLMRETARSMYPSGVPKGAAEAVLREALKRAHPSCPWPPARAGWSLKEEFKSASWRQLVDAWERKFSEGID